MRGQSTCGDRSHAPHFTSSAQQASDHMKSARICTWRQRSVVSRMHYVLTWRNNGSAVTWCLWWSSPFLNKQLDDFILSYSAGCTQHIVVLNYCYFLVKFLRILFFKSSHVGFWRILFAFCLLKGDFLISNYLCAPFSICYVTWCDGRSLWTVILRFCSKSSLVSPHQLIVFQLMLLWSYKWMLHQFQSIKNSWH